MTLGKQYAKDIFVNYFEVSMSRAGVTGDYWRSDLRAEVENAVDELVREIKSEMREEFRQLLEEHLAAREAA